MKQIKRVRNKINPNEIVLDCLTDVIQNVDIVAVTDEVRDKGKHLIYHCSNVCAFIPCSYPHLGFF